MFINTSHNNNYYMIPVVKGQIRKIKIRGVAGDNEGVGLIEGFPVYVKGAKEDEEVKVRIIKIHKYYATGELI